MLAGLVQNPHASNPVTNMTAALDRRDIVANRMAELKIITPAQARAAKVVQDRHRQDQADPERLRRAPSSRSSATTSTAAC